MNARAQMKQNAMALTTTQRLRPLLRQGEIFPLPAAALEEAFRALPGCNEAVFLQPFHSEVDGAEAEIASRRPLDFFLDGDAIGVVVEDADRMEGCEFAGSGLRRGR